MNYRVVNLMNKEHWEGDAKDAKEAYSHINIRGGDTTLLAYGRTFNLHNVKEWKKNQDKVIYGTA